MTLESGVNHLGGALPPSLGNAENAGIAENAGNGKRRAPNAKRFPISTDERDAI
jgi:hypothetical protein